MDRRLGRVVVACLLALGAGAPAARAEGEGQPKDYRVEHLTGCMWRRGCPRLQAKAVEHAQQWCMGAGGVKRGYSRAEFPCEQRGAYCVASGRIECNSTPSVSAPSGAGLQSEVEIAPRTCLDAACSRFVDHYPGRREEGLHACPPGHVVLGLSGAGNDVLCQRVASGGEAETRVEQGAERRGLRACRPGYFLRGVSDDRSRLLCSRFETDPAATAESAWSPLEWVRKEPQNLGLQVCDEREGVPQAVTGLDVGRRGLLCRRLPPGLELDTDPDPPAPASGESVPAEGGAEGGRGGEG